MRILLATDWTREQGGIETYLDRTAHDLLQAGHEVRLLVAADSPAADRADHVAAVARGPWARAVGQLVNPSAVRTIRRVEDEWRPDVLYASMIELRLSPAALLAARTPVVLNVAWYKPTCPTGHRLLPDRTPCHEPAGIACIRNSCISPLQAAYELPRQKLLALARRRARRIVTCSHYMAAELRRLGVSATALQLPVEPRPRGRPIPSPTPLIAACGRLSEEKGLDGLLDAVARLRRGGPDVRVRLVGDGPQRGALERLANELAIADAVEITGWLPHDAVPGAIADAWAVAAPSRWAEPLGLGAIEAIVLGIPVVASATGGYAETVVPGTTGLLVPNGDVTSLTAALRDVVERRTFPALTVDEQAQSALSASHDPRRHLEQLVAVLEDAAE